MKQNFQLDKNWQLHPLDGDTGQAYMGIKEGEKVFIKRNSSPFLAALSREGLTPKLVWSKRLGNGDIVTAQEWLDGHCLTPTEMSKRRDVALFLQYLHYSSSLKNMLVRVGGKTVTPLDLLRSYLQDLPYELQNNSYLISVFRYLEDHLPEVDVNEMVACHGDAVHKNWLVSQTEKLYLVDWDSSMVADPAVDLGTVLGRYIPFSRWKYWLSIYFGDNQKNHISEELIEKIYWYSGMNYLLRIRAAYLKNDYKQSNLEILRLKQLYIY